MKSVIFPDHKAHSDPVELRIVTEKHHDIAVDHLLHHILPFETLPLHVWNLMAAEAHLQHLLPVECGGIRKSWKFRPMACKVVERFRLKQI